MKKIILIVLLILSVGCGRDESSNATSDVVNQQFREFAFEQKPRLNPSVHFELREFAVQGLDEALGMQLYMAFYRSPEGHQFPECMFVYREGEITPFGEVIGGPGLMSAVVSGDALYYTYGWGSGLARSHVGRLTIEDGKIKIVDTGGFSRVHLFVRKVEQGIKVEVGRFDEFNSWETHKDFGWVKSDGSQLAIVDDTGNEITPE